MVKVAVVPEAMGAVPCVAPSSVKEIVPLGVAALVPTGVRVAVSSKGLLAAGVVVAGVTTRVVAVLPTVMVTAGEAATE